MLTHAAPSCAELFVGKVGNDEDLLQRVKIRRWLQQGVFRNAGLVIAGVDHIAQDQILGIDRRAGGDDLVVVAQDCLTGQIIEAQLALFA